MIVRLICYMILIAGQPAFKMKRKVLYDQHQFDHLERSYFHVTNDNNVVGLKSVYLNISSKKGGNEKSHF